MNSLEDLNDYGRTQLEVTDVRPATVVFDRASGTFTPIDIFSTSIGIPTGIEIEEVVNYQTANCRYRLTINALDSAFLNNSAISWPSLPAGVSLTTVGDQYTLSGINSVAIWDQVKNPTWTIPANYTSYNQWYVTAEIIYYDQSLNATVSKSYDIFDRRFYWLSRIYVESNQITTIGKIIRTSSSMSAAFRLEDQFRASLFANSSLSAQGIHRKGIIANVSSNISITINDTLYKGISNLDTARTYIGNQINKLATTDTTVPVIGAPPGTTVTVEFYHPTRSSGTTLYGRIGSATQEGTGSFYSVTADGSVINNVWNDVYLWPDKNESNVLFVKYRQYHNGVFVLEKTITFQRTAVAAEKVITLNSSGSIVFSNEDIKYRSLRAILVGGGGGGQSTSGAGAGGNGAGTNIVNWRSVPTGTVTYTVGTGGFSGNPGQAGTSTTFLGATAVGGTNSSTAAPIEANNWAGLYLHRGGSNNAGTQGEYGSKAIWNYPPYDSRVRPGDGAAASTIDGYLLGGGGRGGFKVTDANMISGSFENNFIVTNPGAGGRGAMRAANATYNATAGQPGAIIIRLSATQ